jgi:hypothetical protein
MGGCGTVTGSERQNEYGHLAVTTKRYTGIALTIFVLAPFCAAAQGANNDQSNFEGDRVSFAVAVKATIIKFDGALGQPVCLPPGTQIWGIGTSTQSGQEGTLFRTKKDVTSCDTPSVQIPNSSKLLIQSKDINPPTPNRSGLTYGILAVPFKFHLSGEKDFTGSATVGPYLGYRADPEGSLGFGIAVVGFLGAANIAVSEPGSGSTSPQNLAGFSYGVGLIGTVKGNFQLGGVLGFDRVSANANYQYNGHPWVAVELGYSFLQ